MNAKFVARWILLAIVVGSIAVYAWSKLGSSDGTAATATPLPNAEVVVTYFTTDVRCDSCLKIEALSRRAIEEGFAAEVASGKVVFRVINTDRPEHRHFVDHYEIANKIVIVSHQRDGQESEWIGRQDIWLLLDEPEEFFAYVREPVRRYIGKS